MTWRADDRRHRTRRRDADDPWTRGDQRDHEQDVDLRLTRIESKVDRLTWIAATGIGVAGAAAVGLPLILR